MWQNPDPILNEYIGSSKIFDPSNLKLYTYTANNPVNMIDPDGNEPVKVHTGTVSDFVNFLNNTSSKMGTHIGNKAIHSMKRLDDTKWGKPVTTPPFNLMGKNKGGSGKGRYIYTKKGVE